MTNVLDRLQHAIADRYVIDREIGRGGMANVYLAHDIRHDRAVAVKVLRPELGVLLGAERFLREIRVVARLHHPHILPVHDSGEVDGALYYVMPYVEGASLRERLRRERPLPAAEAARIACDVAGALDLAHRRGVVHRDIKPGNILFVDGHAVVADFGIARAVHAAGGEMWETITDSGVAIGTPAYMSPEQAVGSATLAARADIYSLGCVLFEMLVGSPPFVGPGGELHVARRFSEDPPRVSTLRSDVPPEIDDVVARALAREPSNRFASAKELADALTPAASSQQTVAFVPTRPPVSRPLALAVASAMVALAAMFVWATRRAETSGPGGDTGGVAGTVVAAPPTVGPPIAAPQVPPPPTSVGAPPGPPSGSATTRSGRPDSATARPGASAAPRATRVPNAAGPATGARAEAVRLDSVFRSVAAAADEVRRRAVASGATAADLAGGDSILAAARRLASAGRWSDALQRAALVSGAWNEAGRVAAARRAADSEVARAPVAPTVTPPAPARAATPRETTVAPPVASPLAIPATDPRVDIGAALGRYARALESRSLVELQAAYPGLTAEQRRSWEQFFQSVATMSATLAIANLDVRGDVAEARVTGQYEYAAAGARRQETQSVAFRATFRRESGVWRLAAVSQ